MHELKTLVQSSNKLLNIHAQEGFGNPGEAGDPQKIIWTSKMLGSVLDYILQWARRVRCTKFEVPFESMSHELSLFVDDLIAQFQGFPRDSLSKVESAIADSKQDTVQRLELTMVFTLANVDGFEAAFASAHAKLGR